ncbi:exosortase A [Rhodoferax koreense]|uniref:Exosortase A n=2 Tax=Rhodoferax koreensis TaxID=1842727 RepID=A0A1P8K4D1_9BURK|nr:exosortase A [Rhodoferax koreense]
MDKPVFPDLKKQWQIASSALVVLVAAILFLYRETGMAMVTIWARSETFTHAFLVPPIALWLVWRKRTELLAQTPSPYPLALVPLACCALLWLLGDLAAVNAVTQLAMTALLVLAVVAVIGWRAARVIAFPLGFLFFAVPIGEFLLPQLMEWTATFTILALRLSGIPVYRDGLQFVIPSGHWSVVEACSGVRYLIASLTVGTLFAYLNFQSNRRRWIFVGVSILVPILANWMRAYLIVLLGHVSGNTVAVGVDHLIYGWLFFGVVVMLMFMIGARWAESPAREAAPLATRSPPTVLRTSFLSMTVAAAALVIALPPAIEWTTQGRESADFTALAGPTELGPGWRRVPNGENTLRPAFHNATGELLATYQRRDDSVVIYLGYYRNQNYERKLVSSDNVLVTSKNPDWAQSATGERDTSFADRPVQVRTAELRSVEGLGQTESARLAVWQFYWLNGKLTSSDYLAKAYSAVHRLLGQGDDAAVIVLSTPLGGDGKADAKLESFMRENFSAIDALLHKMRNGS